MSQLSLSVVICTHQPRAHFFERVLTALDAQTLPREAWELLIIDNASEPLVAEAFGSRAGVQPRIILEPELGLTPARLRAIREVRSDLIVFVDDDNLIAPDYLAHVAEIAERWPQLGTWGGQCIPEWEEEPEPWTRLYWSWIGVREFSGDLWSNVRQQSDTHPFGAGMCVRRSVAEAYAEALATDPQRRALGRTGKRLIGAEDADLALTSCEIGFGNGLFARLKLTHIMPKVRTQEKYLLELVEAMTFSSVMLRHSRGETPLPPSRAQRLLQRYQAIFISERDRQFDAARARGREAALREIAQQQQRSGTGTNGSTGAEVEPSARTS